ncbi:hypothetical protein F383_36914 [Gossypium arboreum]|uniref:Uncharacterized protein n=1 Tax=Gossypium arboreum TaxID=29729 RepID=A0A0B0N9J5_GOSAR|nr:hypothetical protein F383_36914 [Gossypium arboreum]
MCGCWTGAGMTRRKNSLSLSSVNKISP